MQAIWDWILSVWNFIHNDSSSNVRIAITLVAPFVYILTVRFARKVVEARVNDIDLRYAVNRRFRIGIGIMISAFVVATWVGGGTDVAAYVSILSAGLAVSLHAPISNLAGWFFIVVQHPFRLGDRIEIGKHAGDVVDVRLFMFSILEIGAWVEADQSTGRVVHIPNGEVFRQAVTNYAQGFRYIWVEMPVTITFESDWRRGREVLTELVNELAPKVENEVEDQIQASAHAMQIHYRHLTPIVYLKVVECGVRLTLRFLCEPRRRRTTEEAMWIEILSRFANEGSIELAYPTQRFYDHGREGRIKLPDTQG